MPRWMSLHPGSAASLLAAGASALHFASFGIERPLLTDVRYFAYFAWQITQGAVPHLDFFENKTQLASFTGAAFHALGETTGSDPLLAMRVGYIALAAAAGLLAFWVHRRLSGGSQLAGWLGLLAVCAFPLLGILPATGPMPKLWVAVGASLAGLLCYQRRWFLAGVVGALAFMDWQLGALVGLAAFITAWITDSRAGAASVAAGGAAGIAPFALYYSWTGALTPWFQQVVVATVFRGSGSLSGDSPAGGLAERLARIDRAAAATSPGAEWLIPFCVLGLIVALAGCWRLRSDPRLRLLLPLVIFNAGILAFSLLDFQWYGDLFALLHALAFFLALGWFTLYDRARQRFVQEDSPRWVVLVPSTLALAAALVLARPWGFGPPVALTTPSIQAGATLADQRLVAEQVSLRFEGKRLLFQEASELLFLAGITNPLPNIYWNSAAWHYYRQEGETIDDTASRLITSTRPDAFVRSRIVRLSENLRRRYAPLPFVSPLDRYRVVFEVRRELTVR